MWFVFALCSALFAALTSILAKVGIEGVNSTLATAIRTVVVLAMSWGMVFLTGTQTGIADISRRSWLFLVLAGLATGVWKSREEISHLWSCNQLFEPKMDAAQREKLVKGWHQAVGRSQDWAEHEV